MLRGIGAALLALLVLGAAVVAALAWTLSSERGSAWLLSVLPGVEAQGPQGVLLGDFEIERLRVSLPGGSALVLEGLGWRGLSFERGARPVWLQVRLDELHARRVELTPAVGQQAPSQPLQKPASLALPIELVIGTLHVGELHLAALGAQPLRDIQARLHLGAARGREHRIEQLSMTWDQLHLYADAHIATGAPMTLGVQARIARSDTPSALPAWNATLELAGSLEAPRLHATLRARAESARAAQALDVQATLHPFAAWPIGELHASTQALDLSALAAGLPTTSLSGQAVATSHGLDQPAAATIELKNAQPGRWNEGRLPLRTLSLELAGRPDDASKLMLRRLLLELGNGRERAGRISGEGRVSAEGWSLAATLHGVRTQPLDARAAALELSGPVQLSGRGFWGEAGGGIDVQAGLSGTLHQGGPVRPVKLMLDGRFDPQRIELRELLVQAGNARATVSGQARQAAADGPWAVKAEATLVDFDPTAWWVGPASPGAQPGPTRLNAKAGIDLSVPAKALAGSLARLPAALHGPKDGLLATLTLTDSVLAAVPLHGALTLRTGADGSHLVPNLTLDVAGNRLQAAGQLATQGSGASDDWRLSLDAAALERLAPVLDLLRVSGFAPGMAGRLKGTMHVTGRWPEIATQGELAASGLRIDGAGVQQAQARWKLGTRAGAAWDVHASLADATWARGGKPLSVLESAQLQLTGTADAHALEFEAVSRALPPVWTEILQPAAAAGSNSPAGSSPGAASPQRQAARGADTAAGPAPDTAVAAASAAASNAAPSSGTRTVALLQARGGLVEGSMGAPTGWHGTLQRLVLGSNVAGAAPLLAAADIDLALRWSGGPARISVQPGRADVLGGAVRWSRIAWQAADGVRSLPRIDADIEIEPLRIAPLLARAQPGFGWGGDLSVGGHLLLHSEPTFNADVVVERRGGDLTVTDDLGTQALGLTDLRLALNAENGVWTFTQALAGKTLGVAAGAVVARTSPQAPWPAPDIPIEGVLELRVANLGTWGNWVPPGWRLVGALQTSASIGGTLGAPEYIGEMHGSQLGVRNFLEGVHVTDGEVSVSLRGSTAHIERFSARAGSGTLRLEGNASLGAAPEAQLTLIADKAELLGRVDRRIVASGKLELHLDARTLGLNGRLHVDEGLIDFTRTDAPSLSDDVHVLRAATPGPTAAVAGAAPSRAARNLTLDLWVDLGRELRIRGHGLDTGLRGELHITSPQGRLRVNGTVSTARGSFDAYGQKLRIDRGQIIFSGPIESPRLDIVATRPNLDVRVGVAVSGTTANPRVRLFSEPEMSEIDKLSWLVMGRASSGLGRSDTALLQRAALALLAGEGAGPTDKITQAFGLDEISVSQSEGAVSDTVISLGKQLSRRWYVGYERGLNATAGTWQLIYRIARYFTLRLQSGLDNSIDLIWTWRWQ